MYFEYRCEQCGSTEPTADKLGWLVLYFTGSDWSRKFCGSACLNTWSNKAMDRLTKAVLGEEPTIE